MPKYKIYFISSNIKNTPKEFYTEIPGFNNFKTEYKKNINANNKFYEILINSFNIVQNNLIKNKELDAYELTINLKYSSIYKYSSKPFSFVEIKNHFIYGFKLDEINAYILYVKTPDSYILSKKEQFTLYMEFLKLHSDPGDILSNDFCEETINCLIKDKQFDLDIYLDLLKYYQRTKNIFKILDNFEIINCQIPKDFMPDKYESFLEKLKSNEESYTRYCFEDEDTNRIKKKFYTLLLYFRLANTKEKEKPKTTKDERHLWKLFAEIINKNEKLYPIVEIPEEGLIKEIMNQKKISYDLIKKIIASLNLVEQLISFMDKNYDIIFENCQEECSNMIESIDSKILEKNNLTEKEKLLKYLETQENKNYISHKKYKIILFTQKFWDLCFKEEKIRIFMINKSIYVCLINDKKFDEFKKKKQEKINNLKNGQFLQYLSNDISEYEKNNYEIYIYPYNKIEEKIIELYIFLNIFNGINLKTFEKENLDEWKKIKDKIFKLKNIRYNLEDYKIIKEIMNLDEFNKFINLIYDDNDYNYEISYEKDLISKLVEKFLLIFSEKKSEEYFTRIVSILIYKSYQLNLNPEKFICEIEKNINENETIKIYEYLNNYYELISDSLINHMTDYIFKKNNITLIRSLKNIKEKIITKFFAKIDNLIKDEMVYDNLPINIYFKLINDMNEEGYSEYARNNIMNISKALKNLESGMMSYDSIYSIYNNNNHKELFEKKISILLFGNESKITALIKSVKDYLDNCNKNLKILAQLKIIIENYYLWKDDFKRNISIIDKTVDTIKNGFPNENIKSQIKVNLDTLNKIYDENGFHKKYIIKDSLVFKNENIIQGNKKEKIDKVFKNASDKYNELAILFDKNWQIKIKNETIHNYYDIIQQAKEHGKNDKNISLEEKLKKDLEILSKYHNLDKKESEINKLRDDIIIHINFIDIQSSLNKRIAYFNSRNIPSNNEFKQKLQNVIEYLKPKDSSENEKSKDNLLLEISNESLLSSKTSLNN